MNLIEQKQELLEIIARLVELGESADELSFWVNLFETMEDPQRLKLLHNLSEELAALKKLTI